MSSPTGGVAPDVQADDGMITTARITHDWLPLPTAALATLGWREGDEIRLEVIDGSLLAIRVEQATPRDGLFIIRSGGKKK